MISGYDFVVFSDDWGRHPFSCQHIMQNFLSQNKILWVNTVGLRLPEFRFYDLKRGFEKIRTWISCSSNAAVHNNLTIIAPLMIPFNTFAPIRYWNQRSVVQATRSAMQTLGMKNPILLTTLPMACDYVGFLDERLVLYYCVDDFVNWPNMNAGDMVRSMERELLNKANLIVAVSPHLVETRLAKRGVTHLLTHGVDIEHFSKAKSIGITPDALRYVSKPIIGFFGLLDMRMDWGIVKAMLENCPEWSFVFIGDAQLSLDIFKSYPNFLHVPAVSYTDLPNYANQFDVAILPYVVDNTTAGINPLKLKEYFALGVPVVSSPLLGVKEFSQYLKIADGSDAFIEAIREVLVGGFSFNTKELLVGESWQDKAELLSTWIESYLNDCPN